MMMPIAKSMILCQEVLPGPEGTGNVHPMNVFGAIRPRSDPPFPYRMPQMCVFMCREQSICDQSLDLLED